MLYSEEKKFVFVAVPKTGTTAVQNRLREIDPALWHNAVRNAAGERVKMPTHATAQQIRDVMGPRADDVTFIAFLREPRSTLLSKYNFYRSGRAARNQGLAGEPRPEGVRFRPGTVLRILVAKTLPLSIWARVYPFKTGAHFIIDRSGAVIVDRIGLMERLQADVDAIFGALGYDPATLQLTVANRTVYRRSAQDLDRLDAIVARRRPLDYALYDRVRAATSGTAWGPTR